ncbi:coiled-coil protein [Legionella beliardensis]|uniref:Coiled-coil protein n=1 Tax=Legionella beliardensis TaxID=91822 RepID=A0A378I513_9GAMM|nr:hypothetical protein [Legionella beliardensis]STX30103.1 coiled-coil protein [Legionella beliardensis]
MKGAIELSKVTQNYLEQLNLGDFPTIKDGKVASSDLLEWLARERQVDAKQRFLLESLYVAILKDLDKELGAKKDDDSKKKTPWTAKAKFILLAIAGTIFFGCEGFDGVTAILGATSLPAIATFAIGVAFSLISVAVFYAFDLLEVSKNLGVNYKSAPKLVDAYLQKTEYIKSITKTLRNDVLQKTNLAELDEEISLLQLLQKMYQDLNGERQKLKASQNNLFLKAAKVIAAGITGSIFFSGGFFAGQTVALAIAGLIGASVVPTFWPIIAASVFVGIMAFSVYWFVERPGVENLVGKWFGLDKEKIDELCDDEAIKKENEKLNSIEQMLLARRGELVEKQKIQQELTELRTQCQELQAQLDQRTDRESLPNATNTSSLSDDDSYITALESPLDSPEIFHFSPDSYEDLTVKKQDTHEFNLQGTQQDEQVQGGRSGVERYGFFNLNNLSATGCKSQSLKISQKVPASDDIAVSI